jgi:hypothetical protein
MRNLFLLIAISMIIVSCNKDNNNAESNYARIVIKGSISGSNLKSTGTKSESLLSLSDAKKVLVFNSTGYQLFNIEDNAFTASATSGTATALAFLDANNQYIGALCAGGLNVLPLVSLKDGDNTVIDLSSLTLEGTRVIPTNNPIGNEINLNEDEIAWYKELGAYYESLSKNIDADNDGVPDILVKKEFNISTLFDIYCGSWGLNDTPPQINDTAHFFINYAMRIAGGKALIPENENIVLSGPEGSPYTDIIQPHYATGPDCFIAFFKREAPAPQGYPFGSAFLPFAQGIYTVTIDNKSYTLNYSNINAKYFFILAEPTVHTNEANEVVSVSIEYRDMNQALVTAENYVFQTQVTLDGFQGNRICQVGTLWENPEAKTNTELYTFILPEPVPLANIRSVGVCYVDMIGNAYNIGFIQ